MQFLNRAASAAVAACALAALAACGGGGGGSSDNGAGSGSSGGTGGSSGGSGDSSSPYVLFASDGAGDVAAFTTLSPAAGTSVTGHVVVTMPDTGDTMAYDAGHDELYLLYRNPTVTPMNTLEVFAHASTMKAGAAPSRRVALPDLVAANVIVLDTLHDRLWITGSNTDLHSIVAVYDHASTLTGSAAASRTLNVQTSDIAVDAERDLLYASETGGIAVFKNASTLSGAAPEDHGMVAASWNGPLALDASRDILYYVDWGTATVYVAHGASTTTSAAPMAITLPAGAELYSVAIDAAHDRLYVGGQNTAYIIENASTLSAGAVSASMLSTPVTVSAFAFAGQ